MKERFMKYSGAVTKYCKDQSRKPPFIKNMLCFLQEAITKEAAPIESIQLHLFGFSLRLQYIVLTAKLCFIKRKYCVNARLGCEDNNRRENPHTVAIFSAIYILII
jgi:hypothetical protein